MFLQSDEVPKPPEDFLKFAKVVNGIFYIDAKHADRIKPFAQNKAVVDYVCDMIDSFSVPASEVTQSMAYSLLLLAYSKTDRAVGILERLCQQAIDEDYFGMCQYLEDDFQKAYKRSHYFKFADMIGLDVSLIAQRMREGDYSISSSYSFELSTVAGVMFEAHASDEDKKHWYNLCVRIYGPGAYHDFDIDILSNHEDHRTYSLLWNSPYEPYHTVSKNIWSLILTGN